ncbi:MULTISPECIES: DUF2612 domain-containing protein [unclassified Acinetobacter]|uniref:DUF2612 domain-containing protein n=1 Tax=unclassified Acinetobacter TaxID=196816 RepID=UPI002934B985|nr:MULTISPECIES: DUF2612 domain-containing protein [unclassified Acinetobacter]WOE32191.1 DUF2612 domain-containing protein [Acinetobacter sp. SAAs470]WOE37661.1 DUF2612 domain-containing protein [Acinetobacter sp. SAAs474]
MNENKYLDLITSQHRQPKFQSVVSATTNPVIDCINLLQSINEKFDIDSAVGSQLQIIAEWIGAPNSIANSVPVPFFGFKDQLDSLPFGEQDGTSWGGYWRESGMNSYKALTMSSTLFKRAIKAQIKLNQSDCSIESVKEVIELITDKAFKIKDNNDMSVTFSFLENYEDWEREFVRIMFPLPAGVRLIFGGEDEY